MNEHFVQDLGQTGGSSPGLENTLGLVPGDYSLAPSKPGAALSDKLRRHGVKAVTALKSLTSSCTYLQRLMPEYPC